VGIAVQLQPGCKELETSASITHHRIDLPRGQQVLADVLRRKPRARLAIDDNGEGWSAQAMENLVLAHKHEGISRPVVLELLKAKLERLVAPR